MFAKSRITRHLSLLKGIRIAVVYDTFTLDHEKTTYVQNTIIPKTVEIIRKALKVKKPETRLMSPDPTYAGDPCTG